MDDNNFNKVANKKNVSKDTLKKLKFNHLINVFIYNNIALFKGDTYPYRGTFKRCGGDFNKKHYGYLVPLDRLAECKMQISKFVESLLVYKKDTDLEIDIVLSNLIDEEQDSYSKESNESNNYINKDNVMDL